MINLMITSVLKLSPFFGLRYNVQLTLFKLEIRKLTLFNMKKSLYLK